VTDAATVTSLAALAGALSIDSTAAVQAMVSQPVVAGALAGLICGDPATGAVVGAALQLIWLGALPVGAAGFPDAPVGTVVGVGASVMVLKAGGGAGWAVPIGLASALLMGEAGRLLVARLRRWNVRLSDYALARADAGDGGGVARAVGLGLSLRFAAGTVLAFAALSVALVIVRTAGVPAPRAGFPPLLWAAPVGAAVVAQRSRRWGERWLLAAGFATGLVVTLTV